MLLSIFDIIKSITFFIFKRLYIIREIKIKINLSFKFSLLQIIVSPMIKKKKKRQSQYYELIKQIK